jgi:hypothetical protein
MEEYISTASIRRKLQDVLQEQQRETVAATHYEGLAKACRGKAAAFQPRVDLLQELLSEAVDEPIQENVIPLRNKVAPDQGIKPERKFRTPGVTTDIANKVYHQPGVLLGFVTAAMHEKHPDTDPGTIRRMVNRMVREGYMRRDADKLFLTDLGIEALEASPLREAA